MNIVEQMQYNLKKKCYLIFPRPMGYRMLVRLVRAAFASAVTFHGHLVLVCEPLFPHHQTKSRQIPKVL